MKLLPSLNSNDANQKGARAGHDLAGRDINHYNINLIRNERVKELVARLDREIARDETRDQWIETLEFFEEPFAPDGIVGLEAKLKHGGREDKIAMALRHKELFVKFLSKYALYGAAQELLALCLHRIHLEFDTHVHPACDQTPISEVDQLIATKVVSAVVDEYGLGTFALNHGLVLGMTYWLAERCYVRWHT